MTIFFYWTENPTGHLQTHQATYRLSCQLALTGSQQCTALATQQPGIQVEPRRQ